MSEAVQSPGVISAFREAGVDPHGSTPEAFHAFISTELARWQPIVTHIKEEA